MRRKAALLALLIAFALVGYFLLRHKTEANAESRFDGVHLCSPAQEAAATAQAAAATQTPEPEVSGTGNDTLGIPSNVPVSGSPGSQGPFFAQNAPDWGKDEYDHGSKQDVGCGTTIAQCGCAMTSVATVLDLFQVVTTPEGSALNPETLNGWFNENAQLTGSGWVSQGYAYGNVVWTAANNFSAADPSAPSTVRYKGWGTGSEAEIRSELSAGRPVVLEVPGHYIAAVALEGDQIMINDPYYRDRTTLSSYAGRVKSSRLYEPSQDLRSLVITVPANVRVQVKDPQGRNVGTLSKGSPSAAEKNAVSEIPGASYHFEEAWRDPTCTERPPPDGAGVNTIFIPNPTNGAYTVEVMNPSGGDTASVVYAYDIHGKLKMETHTGGKDIRFQIDYNSGASTTQPGGTPTATPTGTATASPTAEPAATETPVPSETPEPTQPPAAPTDTPPAAEPTIAPTPTETPAPANTPTLTPTETPTLTPTPTRTPTRTPIPPSTLTITAVYNATSDGLIAFNYSGSLGNFTLHPFSGHPDSHSSGSIAAGTYTVTQTVAPTSISCFSNLGGASFPVDLAHGKVTVNLRVGEIVVCTFDNTPPPPPTPVPTVGLF